MKTIIETVHEWWKTNPVGDGDTKFFQVNGIAVEVNLYNLLVNPKGTYIDCNNSSNMEITWWRSGDYHNVGYDFHVNIDLYVTLLQCTVREPVQEGEQFKDDKTDLYFDKFGDFSEESFFQYSTVYELPSELTEKDIILLHSIAQDLLRP